MFITHHRRTLILGITSLFVSTAALGVTACDDSPDNSSPQAATSAAVGDSAAAAHGDDQEHDHGHHHDASGAEQEVASLPTRVVLSHDGGLTTLDALSGETVATTERPGFLRLSHIGDGRHVMVSAGDEFLSFDTGLIKKPHGDHNHYYTADPTLESASHQAPHAGHVVHHAGKTALFSDGTGKAEIYDTAELADGAGSPRIVDSGAPHHGVAVPLEDGKVLITHGTEDERHTIRLLDNNDKVIAETTDCPGVHGEAVAAGDHVVFGCENGPVVFDGNKFHKAEVAGIAKDDYQRSGNLAGSPESAVVLGDNKTDKDAEQERPTSINLIDSSKHSVRNVELGSSYWFRSLARGEKGEALVLTSDGKLNVIDPDTGEVTEKIEAIAPWEEKAEWQEPGPILQSRGGLAYVTDAEKQELVVIDYARGKVIARHSLDFAPVEMSVADGKSED